MRQNVAHDNFSECVTETPLIGSKYDATLNNSAKTFTVPLNECWKINYAHVKLITTGTVGNRNMMMEVFDSDGNSQIDVVAGTTQAASLTRHYAFLQGIYRETAFVSNELQIPIPSDLYLPAGWSVKFYDSAAVDAAADDMTVSFQYKKMVV